MKKKNLSLLFLGAMCTSFIFLFLGLKNQTETEHLLDYEKNTIEVYEKNSLSVVNVTNIKYARTWSFDILEIPKGTGSGFVWDTQGHIVTNYHVIEGGDNFLISFSQDQKQYRAKVVGIAPSRDLAVLKLVEKPATLNPVTIGVSKDLRVGQKVIAIGNPFGFDFTMTTGIVSALGRKIDGVGGVKIHDMIQTDASINPGNSGGPLLDSRGRLIGMNTSIYSQSGTSSGVGFAVPADDIGRFVPQLIRFGRIIRPGLNISLLPDHIKESFGLEKGLVVAYVPPKSSAAQAGLKGLKQDMYGRIFLGDVILAIEGKETNSYDDIFHILENFKIGDVVEVTVQRGESIKKVKIQLTQQGEEAL